MECKRILVIGSPGSGKTTFSSALSEKLGIEAVHLDRLFWRDNWVNVSSEEFDRQLREELLKDSWIMDGNYNRTIGMRMERCDTVFWLDYPALTSLFGYFKRLIKNRGTSRPDMGGYCPERLDLEFVKFILTFNKTHRKRYREMLSGLSDKSVYIFRSRRESEEFLENIK